MEFYLKEDDIINKDYYVESNAVAQKSAPSFKKSDVDYGYKPTNKENDNTYAVIIANESYTNEDVPSVPFANNDGQIFSEYCLNLLGLPQKNIRVLSNATKSQLSQQLKWLSRICEASNGEANVIFYYAGHGIPDDATKTSYLLPSDGDAKDSSTGFKLDDLYKSLGSMGAKSVVVFMDACFSGAGLEAMSRGIRIKPKEGIIPNGKNMVVFSATQGDERSYPYKEESHGLFTYFLLKKLKDSNGKINLGDLADYLSSTVKLESVKINNKMQTPLIQSQVADDSWKKWKLCK